MSGVEMSKWCVAAPIEQTLCIVSICAVDHILSGKAANTPAASNANRAYSLQYNNVYTKKLYSVRL